MGLNATLDHNGTEYTAELAIVEDTTLGEEDHGIWTAVLHFTGMSGSWGQSNSPRGLDTYDKATKRRVGTAFGMDHVMAICRALGCRRWEDVKGVRCIVLRRAASGQIEGIADLSGERVLIFQAHADIWFPRADEERAS